jgi:hypothetical protein
LVDKNAAAAAGESYPFHPVLTTTILTAAAIKKGEGLTHGEKSAKKQSSEKGKEAMTEFKKRILGFKGVFAHFLQDPSIDGPAQSSRLLTSLDDQKKYRMA